MTAIPFVVPGVTEKCGGIIQTANFALLLNNRGDVAGYAPNNCEADFTAWIWTNGDIINLGAKAPRTPTYPGGPLFVGFQSYPGAMNERGQVVGWASSCFVECRRPVFWDPNNGYNGIDLIGQSPAAAPNCLQNASPPFCVDDTRSTGSLSATGEVAFTVPLLNALHNYQPFGRSFIYRHGIFEDAATAPPIVPAPSAGTTNRHGQTISGAFLIDGDVTYRISDLVAGGLPASFTAIAINDLGQILGQAGNVAMLLTRVS